MNSGKDSSKGIHQIEADGRITVEVIDLVQEAESEDPHVPYPKEKQFEEVEILESGWVRCVREWEYQNGTPEPLYDSSDVNYYPPERVNGIYAANDTNGR